MNNHIIDLYYVTAKAFMASNNYKDAKHYLKKSIEKYDNPISHEEIGIIFFRENKIKEALKHLFIAAKGNQIRAISNIGNYFEQKDQLEEAKKYYHQAALLGYSYGYYSLARLAMHSSSESKNNIPTVIEYLKKGAELEEKGNYENIRCSEVYALKLEEYGLADPSTLPDIYRKLEQHGSVLASYKIAYHTLYGQLGFEKNEDEALKRLIYLAIAKKHKDSCDLLRRIYNSDEFNMRDIDEAGTFLLTGVNALEVNCLLEAAEITLEGKGKLYKFPPDEKEFVSHCLYHARKIISISKRKNNNIAKERFNKILEKYPHLKDELDVFSDNEKKSTKIPAYQTVMN